MSTEIEMRGGASTVAKVENHYDRFSPFFKALQEKDWKGVVEFVREKQGADQGFMTSRFKFSIYYETIFHLISRNLSVPVSVFEDFASMVQPEPTPFIENQFGQSPLFMAALSANINAAKFFVRKDKDMPNRRKKVKKGLGQLPIQSAAKWGHKEIIRFLWDHTTESLDGDVDEKNNEGVIMLKNLIKCDHYDMAFELLKKYPKLARENIKDRASILEMLASRPSAFKSGSQLGFWESKIYEWIPVPEEHIPPPPPPQTKSEDADEENQKLMVDKSNRVPKKSPSFNKLCIMLWKPLILVPGIKSLLDTKLMHMHTLEIVKSMCNDVNWSYKKALEYLWTPLSSATRLGICEIVDEILKTNYYSYALHGKDKTYREDILTLAIRHHQEKVFHLITEMKVYRWEWIVAPEGKEGKKTVQHAEAEGKNLLHLAATYVHSNQVSGAALQMQRELQWFKAVQSFLHPSHQEQRVGDHNQTPRELFTENHKKLVEEGEKWMKDTATSCSVVGALIITVAFAAAFTVPGGNDAEGFPLFLHEPPFIIFIISDALALFSSAASVFTFLGMLTSRYSEDDFLKSSPRKLIFGLITLFFSIASVMTAFITAIYILLSDLRSAVFIPIVLLGGLTVVLFLINQLPLVIEMYSSTYRSIPNPPRK